MLKSEDFYEPNISRHYCLYFFINLMPPAHHFYWNCPLQGLQIHPNDQIKSNGLSSFLTHHGHSGIGHCWATSYKLLQPACPWQHINLPNHILSTYLPSLSWQNSTSSSHHLSIVMYQGLYFGDQHFLF